MYEYYLPFVGKSSPRRFHRISADAIRRFAVATGENDPVYFDEEYARSSRYGRMIAPPTFCHFLSCAEIPGMWFAPTGRILAGQRFVFHRPLYADELVSVEKVISKAYEKTGKQGTMVFLEETKRVYDENDRLICSSIMTTITMADLFPADPSALAAAPAIEPAALRQARPSPILTVGLRFPQVDLPPVTRLDLIRFAGASGDFNPIHLADETARQRGYPSVIVHGMLTAALQSRVVAIWLGDGYRMTAFSLKMTAPVFPGDPLHFQGQVKNVDADAGTASVVYQVTNGQGQTVLTGDFQANAF